MNPTIIRNISRARVILQKTSNTLHKSPRLIAQTQFFKPIPPRVCFAAQAHNSVASFRWLSTTRKLYEQIRDTTADWQVGPIPDAVKWSERMDYFAAKAMENEDDLINWITLLQEGCLAGVPNIQETIIRNRQNSQAIDQYLVDFPTQDYDAAEFYNQPEYEMYDEYDEDDDGFDEEYDTIDEISDEDIEELLEQAEEEQGDWRIERGEGQWEHETGEDSGQELPDRLRGEELFGEDNIPGKKEG